MENVFFHIGTPKTGTSLIQSHLAQNRTALRDRNFFYPITISSQDNVYRTYESHHLLTYSWADWKPFNVFSPDWFFDKALSTARTYGLHTLLLSAENAYWLPYQLAGAEKLSPQEYWDRKRQYIARIQKDLGRFNTKIVVYLRRQDRWIESWYNQQVKNGHSFDRDMDRFIGHFEYLLDHAAHLDLWSECFGKENIIVKVYEKEQLPNGLFSDFVSTVGLGDESDFPLKMPARHNSQLSPHALAFMEICNNLKLDPQEHRRLRLIIRKVTNQFESRLLFQSQSLLSPGQRDRLLERFEPGNRGVARDYLGRSDGKLFYEAALAGNEAAQSSSDLPIDVAAQLVMQVVMELTRAGDGGKTPRQFGAQSLAHLRDQVTSLIGPLVKRDQRSADDAFWDAHIWDYEQP